MKPLQNKVALVTGASREIGAEMAFELAQAGASVVVAHFGEPDLAQQTAQRIQAAGGNAIVIESDGRRVSECYALVDKTVQAFGRVDILAANAGITRFGKFLEFDEATYDAVMDTNLKGSFFLAQAVAKQMAHQSKTEGGYRMVFSSSVVGQVGVPTMTAYGITKIGVSYLAKSLGVALAPHGITANALIIGAVVNARNLADDPNYAENFGRILPIGRAIYPSDVAAALMYLVSPAASAVTGHSLAVDGGHTLMVASSGSPQTNDE